MNNRTMRFSVGAFAVGAIALLTQTAQSQTITYNNTTTFQGDFNYGATGTGAAAGNEIILATGNQGAEVTSFSFQYDFLNSSGTATGTPAGGETADLIFYQNNGTKVSGASSPSTVLYNSGALSIASAFTTGSTITFSVANSSFGAGGVDVPQIFTWAVTFAGIPSTESAGLALFSPPTVGGNYADAWYNSGSGWTLDVASGSNPPLEFGAQVTTVPEPSSLGLFAMGTCGLLASGWRKLRR